jgi:hypothetical protein
MKTYRMRLVNVDDFSEVLAVANTRLGLLRKYNKSLTAKGFNKISLADLENNVDIEIDYQYGNFDIDGYDIETGIK